MWKYLVLYFVMVLLNLFSMWMVDNHLSFGMEMVALSLFGLLIVSVALLCRGTTKEFFDV